MGRSLDDVIKSLPAERQARIAAASKKKVEEMLGHASTLTDFRKAVGRTQAEVARSLGINQNAVSQLERRTDTYVSTLRRFLKSLDLTLELSVVDKNGVRIDLPNFLHLPASDSADNADSKASAEKAPARKPAAKPASSRKIASKAVPAKKAAAPAKRTAPAKKRPDAAQKSGRPSRP
jgi:transcriptional regulator with XRE-family HTH domain